MLGIPTMFVAALLALASAPEETGSFVAWAFPAALLYEIGALTGAVAFVSTVGGLAGGLA